MSVWMRLRMLWAWLSGVSIAGATAHPIVPPPAPMRERTAMASRAELESMAATAATAHGIPVALFQGLVTQESAWNPNAIRQEVAVGDASRGLTQVLLSTARGEGYTGAADGLFDPVTNLNIGASYLARQYQRWGAWDAALAAYNGGPAAGARVTVDTTWVLARDQVTGAVVRTFTAKPGQFKTQPYVDAVLAAAGAYGYVTGGTGGVVGLVLVLGLLGALVMRARG